MAVLIVFAMVFLCVAHDLFLIVDIMARALLYSLSYARVLIVSYGFESDAHTYTIHTI